MYNILIRACSFLFIIILGYILKKRKFYSDSDSKFVNKTVINIMLPSVIISSFGNFQKDNSLFSLIILGLLFNIILITLGYIFSRNNNMKEKALYMLGFSGYNIGSFTIPFVQSFLGSIGVVALCMFDIGNSLSCTGGSYAITSSVIAEDRKGISFKFLIERLKSSAPFMTYLLMLILLFFNIKIPSSIIVVTSLIGSANSFMSMFMIGLMFDIKFKKEYLIKAFTLLSIRYLIALILALLIWKIALFDDIVNKVLVIAIFSPISVLSPLFVEKCEADSELASFINSLSIVISGVIIVTLIPFFKI